MQHWRVDFGSRSRGGRRVSILPEHLLSDTPVSVIVTVLRTHVGVFDGYQPVLKIPGAGQAVDIGHVAVGIVAVNTGLRVVS